MSFRARLRFKASGLKGPPVTPSGLAMTVVSVGPGVSQMLISGVVHGQA
jgi:hypothetical protein